MPYIPKVYKDQGGDRLVVASGGTINVESGGAFQLAGTALSATAAEVNQYAITTRIADISTASSAWVVAPHAGNVVKIYSVIDGAITAADAVLTPKIATVAITGGAITIATASSAAGDVDSSTPSAANAVTAGQAIEIATDGGSTGTVSAVITLVIER